MENYKNLEEILEKFKLQENLRYVSPYKPLEKDTNSNFFVSVEEGTFIKEKARSYEKTFWEFYMLWVCNRIFEKVSRKNKDLQVKIKVPEPYAIEKNENLRIYMEFIPGIPIKKYSEKSKEWIDEKVIKIKKKKLNLINLLAFMLGVVDRIKSNYYIFHGDMDFRHVMFDFKNLIFSLVGFDKAFVYLPEYNIDKKILERAITHEREKTLANLEDKFSHLKSYGEMVYFFNKGRESPRLKNINIENYVKEFYQKYNIIPKIPKSVLDRIKEAAEKY